MLKRPSNREYVPYYATYIAHAEDNALAQLRGQAACFEAFRSFPEDLASASPAPGEWSLKEVLQHLCDFERMFAYRALRFSRGDLVPIEAFDQDEYIKTAGANSRTLDDIVTELVALRQSSLIFFAALTPAMLDREGSAGGNPVTVRVLVYITAGHSEVHLRDIRRTFVPPSKDR